MRADLGRPECSTSTPARRELPITEQAVYLNHAAICPIPRRSRDAMVRVADEYLTDGVLHGERWHARYREVRELGARLVNARPEQIGFIKNTSEGLSFAANGVDWHVADNVVVPGADFPTVVLPWLNLERHGVEVRRVPSRDGRLSVDDFVERVDARTRVLVCSTVQFSSGFRVDLAQLSALCREHDLLFVVDGIQSLGALALDVQAAGIDVLAADAHKWLLGPQGIGLLYLSDRALERLAVQTVGWLSVNEPFAFRYEVDLLPDARRFEPGSPNTVGIYGLGGTLDLLLELGVDTIEARVLALTDRLCAGLVERGYRVRSPRDGFERSGIVVFDSVQHPTEALFERLSAERIVVSVGGGGIRVSPHCYNTEAEIDLLLATLA